MASRSNLEIRPTPRGPINKKLPVKGASPDAFKVQRAATDLKTRKSRIDRAIDDAS